MSWHIDHYDVRITYPDGTRSNPRCLEQGTSEARARETARSMTEQAEANWPEIQRRIAERRAGRTPAETVSAWCVRWCADRRARGLTSVSDDEGRLKKWILPEIGEKPIAGERRIQKPEIEALVEKLDEHVREARMSWKTATNCWGLVSKMMKDASNAKTKSLRVRDDNPALNVVGPDRGDERGKAYLYPSEFLKLVRCDDVPLRWRRLFALAIYTYARAGELEALELEDIDREHGFIHIHRALDQETKEVRETKTGIKRKIPIEPNLAPLIDALVEEATARGDRLLFDMPPACDLSAKLRLFLRRAGVARAELFANDLTRKQITFHDLRATGITWMAVRGDAPQRIQSRAGHERFDTTQGYIREAENLEGAITPEETFPALPPELFSSTASPSGAGESGLDRSSEASARVQFPLGSPNTSDAEAVEPPEAPAAARIDVPNVADSLAPDDDGGVAAELRRLADAARELATRVGGDEGVVLFLAATEIGGELDELADAAERRRAS